MKGIDVSKHNGAIDWAKVKSAGIDFAMLRAGYGRYDKQKDECFEENYAGAKAAGLHIGAYHYSYAKTVEQATQEAQTFIGWLQGKSFDFPVAFDIEDRSQASLGKELISDIIRAFCSAVEAAGYYVIVYANKDWLVNRIDEDCKTKYDVWLAQWADKPSYTGEYGMWQYTSDGTVDGIQGRVDMNEAYKDYPAIIGGTVAATAPTDETIHVEYQAYVGGKWLPWVEDCNDVNPDGYAGLTGKAITAIRAGLSKGQIQYRAHTKGGKLYAWITDYNNTNTNGYAGVLGKDIDLLQMTLVGLPGYAVEYRVAPVGKEYLPWVRDYNTTNANGYAGLKGKSFDRLQIRVVKV